LLNRFAPSIARQIWRDNKQAAVDVIRGTFMRTRALGAKAALAAAGLLAAMFVAMFVDPAQAQDVRVIAPAPPVAPATIPSVAPSVADDSALAPLSPEESDLLGRVLMGDPASLADGKPPRALKRRTWSKSLDLDVKGTDRPDGSSSVALKQPIAVDSAGIDSSVGADLNLAAHPSTIYQPGQALPGMATAGSGGAAAWATVGMSNLASVQARVDPAADQGKIGGKLSRSVPVGRDLSFTVEDSYTMTESLGAPPLAPATPMSVTAPGGPGQVFDNSKSVKFVVNLTGTSFAAAQTTASNDPVTHNTFSADQKLMGPLHITTAVTDVGQPTANKSITAGFKLNW
jgi:hypothetical protein